MQYEIQATKKLNSLGFLNKNKFEEAADLFSRAGNEYKVAKSYDKAIQMYENAYNCYLKEEQPIDAVKMLINCFNLIENVPEKIIKAEQISALYFKTGSFYAGAKYLHFKAQLEQKEGLLDESINSYKNAIEHYRIEKMDYYVETLYRELILIYTELENYDEIVKIFDKMYDLFENKPYYKFKNDKDTTSCILCLLQLQDVVGATKRLNRFLSTVYIDFCKEIFDSITNSDSDAFTITVQKYEYKMSYDDWTIKVLYKIKQQLLKDDTESLA